MHPVPVFFLYGEPRREVGPRFLHLEALADRSKPSAWNIRPHAHTDLNHVFLITTGSGTLTADGASLAFSHPSLLLIPAGVVHGFTYEPETTGFVLTIAGAYLADLIAREPDFSAIFTAPVALTPEDAPAIEERLRRLSRELVWNAPGAAAAIEGHLLGLLVELLRLSHHAAPPPAQNTGRAAALVAKFRARIEATYRTNATLEAHAAALRVTQAQLRRACLQITQEPPLMLIQHRLFLEAQRILLYTTMTIAEAADHLGFADAAYFTRFFTKHAGLSPRAFRTQNEHRPTP